MTTTTTHPACTLDAPHPLSTPLAHPSRPQPTRVPPPTMHPADVHALTQSFDTPTGPAHPISGPVTLSGPPNVPCSQGRPTGYKGSTARSVPPSPPLDDYPASRPCSALLTSEPPATSTMHKNRPTSHEQKVCMHKSQHNDKMLEKSLQPDHKLIPHHCARGRTMIPLRKLTHYP